MNQPFPEDDLDRIHLPFVEPGVPYRPFEHFGPQSIIQARFRNSPFGSDGQPREISEDDIEVVDNAEELIPSSVFEDEGEDEETSARNAALKMKLRSEVAKIGPRPVTLVARHGVDRWSREFSEIAVIHEGTFIGSLSAQIAKKAGKMLIRMAGAGFVFSTTAVVMVAETKTYGLHPGLHTGLNGLLRMPEAQRLKDYDPTEPGLFDPRP